MRKRLTDKKVGLPLLVGVLAIILLSLYLTQKNSGNPLSYIPSPQNQNLPQNMPNNSPSTSASASPRTQTLRLFFIALDDNGQKGEMVGCGDSIAPVDLVVPETQSPLKDVMQQLLSIKQETVGPSKLYNSLAKSKLEVKDVNIKNNVAIVNLTGSVSLGGECDSPRFQAQLEKTAKQFSDITQAQIFINDKPLSEVVSLK